MQKANQHQTINSSNLNQQNTFQSYQPVINQPVVSQPVVNAPAKNNNNVKVDSANNIISNTAPVTAQQNNPPGLNNIDSAQKQNSAAVAASSIKIKLRQNTHYFYAGLMAGADLSFIKYQNIEPLGYNFGLLVGYKFKKISIDKSGLYFAKKNYYTSGEYFG